MFRHHRRRAYALLVSLILALAAAAFVVIVGITGTSPSSFATDKPIPGGTPPPAREEYVGSLAVLIDHLPKADIPPTLPVLPTI